MEKELVITMSNGDEYIFVDEEAENARDKLEELMLTEIDWIILRKNEWKIVLFRNHILSIARMGV